MNRKLVLVAALALISVCASLQAATVYKVTFDQGVAFDGVAVYSVGAGEILPAGVKGVLLNVGQYPDSTRRTGNLIDPDPTGLQGGQALNLMIGGAWDNKQGYYFGRDYVAEGDNYDTHTYPASGCPDPVGDAGPTVENAYTLEVVVRPDFTPTDAGRTTISTIFDSVRVDGPGGAGIAVDQYTGIVTYNSGQALGGITSATALQSGEWYHIAVVVRPRPHTSYPQRTELWINGVLDGVGDYPAGWETQGVYRIPGYFTVGTAYWPTNGRNWQGQIDAFAISDVALDGGTFVLPVGPPLPPPAASTIYKITFDRGPLPYAPLDYVAGRNEVLPDGVHGVPLNWGSYPDSSRFTGNLIDPLDPGVQGGQALNMMLSGSWPNKQGYYFGRDYVANGTNYDAFTYQTYGCPNPIGEAGPVIENEYTLEAVVRPDYSRNPGLDFGLTSSSVIFDSVRLDGIPGGACLVVDQTFGFLTYQAGGPGGIGDIYANTLLQEGQWYHIAAVVRPSPTGDPNDQRTELWINGVLDEVGGYPIGWETQGLFRLPGYFTIGTQYWPMSGRNWQGQIDAVAISDRALDPTSFVLTAPVVTTPISDAKQLDDLEPVTCRGVVTAQFDGFFYIENPDRSTGIRVATSLYAATPGQTATATGFMGTLPWGERQIIADSVLEVPGAPVEPLAMINKALGGKDAGTVPGGTDGVVDGVGLNNVGLYIRATGKVSNSAFGYFDLDDGSGVPVRALLLPGADEPADDAQVIVTGVSSCEKIGPQATRLILVSDWYEVMPY